MHACSTLLDVDLNGRTERAVSRLESRLLETRIVPGWRDYLRGTFIISRALTMLECEVQDIEKTLLVGILRSLQSVLPRSPRVDFSPGPHRRCPPAQTHGRHTRKAGACGRGTAAPVFRYVRLLLSNLTRHSNDIQVVLEAMMNIRDQTIKFNFHSGETALDPIRPIVFKLISICRPVI
jgi:hypothetical protein